MMKPFKKSVNISWFGYELPFKNYKIKNIGKVVGSISLKQLLRLCHKNFNCIDGLQVPQSDCLQSSPDSDDGRGQPRKKTIMFFARYYTFEFPALFFFQIKTWFKN